MEQVFSKGYFKESHQVSTMTSAIGAISAVSYPSPLEGIRSVAVTYSNQAVSIDYDSVKITIEPVQKKSRKHEPEYKKYISLIADAS